MSDDELRALERQVQESDSPAARLALAVALERAGRRVEAIDALEPHALERACPAEVASFHAALREALWRERAPMFPGRDWRASPGTHYVRVVGSKLEWAEDDGRTCSTSGAPPGCGRSQARCAPSARTAARPPRIPRKTRPARSVLRREAARGLAPGERPTEDPLRHARIRLARIAPALVAVLAIGCGSSHSGTSASTAPGSTSTAAASTNPGSTTLTTTAWTPPAPSPSPSPAASPSPSPSPSPPALLTTATLVTVVSSEFGGGFGAPPPPGVVVTPPPPSITFTATFQNTGTSDLAANDPRVAVELRWADPQSPTQVTVVLAPLTASILAGGQGDEVVDTGPLARVLDPVLVTASLVQLDPATGAVVGHLSPAGSLAPIAGNVYYPP